jgi:rhamnose utilization protein RhaD (predicted bifunctional aldolase and dehydrogenase)/NAD(P)-dependent dehydrogenase (short-subunit alcohol dehydrogenase family)
MEKHLADLIEISQYYGRQKNYVIAGGGNTSWKNDKEIWVKGSGSSLAHITAEGFARMNRRMMQDLYFKQYDSNPVKREADVKEDLQRACLPGSKVRPSVESSLHELINYPFVVHTHPTLVNAVTCAVHAEQTIQKLFGDDVLYVPYTDPGYILFAKIRDLLLQWRKDHANDPTMIFLQNHGVFVAADSTQEIRTLYSTMEAVIQKHIRQMPAVDPMKVPDPIVKILPGLRMILSDESLSVARIRSNSFIRYYTDTPEHFSGVSLPFIPDQIVYCKARPLYIEQTEPAAILNECRKKLTAYKAKYGYPPKIIGLKGFGIIAVEDSVRSVNTMLDVFEDWMQISYLTESFGGPRFMSERDIEFIDQWEVENYRRQVARAAGVSGRLRNKVAIVTGGAQGFGSGIVNGLMAEGAQVAIADLNLEKGTKLALELNARYKDNEAYPLETNVTQEPDIERLVYETVVNYGGIDILVSNAGVLRAGGLDEMTMDTFELMTRVNYSAYFLCTKYISEIMKLQASQDNSRFFDIIQINSKSGLKGSNRNFAYAGGKFGGIGLTQSFALELMPWRIKVNSICPGNFFEGPLWSDPETGLFVQYLKAGKVPGAKTIDDVRIYYEKQVPAGRGCQVSDVMKALIYVIEQEYETGQALPVTGGQEMLR